MIYVTLNPCPACGKPAVLVDGRKQDVPAAFIEIGCPDRCWRRWTTFWFLRETRDIDDSAVDRLKSAWNIYTGG